MKEFLRTVYNNKVMLTFAVGFVLFLSVIGCVKLAQADEMKEYEKSFISIEINRGDTLTSIAKEYAKSEADYQTYIEEVRSINNLNNDMIHDGCFLLVPVYELVE